MLRTTAAAAFLFFLCTARSVHAGYYTGDTVSQNWEISGGGRKGTRDYVAYFEGSPVVLDWDAYANFGDDEYLIQVRNDSGGSVLYQTPQYADNKRDTSPRLTASTQLYQIIFKCDLEFGEGGACDGSFRWTAVECGCPSDYPVKVPGGDCEVSGQSSTPVKCRDNEGSQATPVGYWFFTDKSGPLVERSESYGTTVTDGSTITTELSESFTETVSIGVSYGAVSGEVSLSQETSSTIGSQASSSISEEFGSTFTVKCREEGSSTGLWFLWQWALELEADDNGPGFNTKTSNYVCTDSANKPPLCPFGYCNDLQCQTCAPYEDDQGNLITSAPVAPPPVNPPPVAPAPAPAPAPVAPPAPTGFLCFSKGAQVQVEGKGATQMHALAIGDSVLTSKGYSKVYSFAHFAPDAPTEFLQIRTKGLPKPLEITVDHILPLVSRDGKNGKDATMLPAGAINVGDFLLTEDGPSMVVSIGSVSRVGAYDPLTTTGDIIVDGIVCSNYVALTNHIALRALEPFLSYEAQHSIEHFVLLPYRSFCNLFGCENETYDKATGIPKCIAIWLPLLLWLERPHCSIALVAALLGFLVWKKQQDASKYVGGKKKT